MLEMLLQGQASMSNIMQGMVTEQSDLKKQIQGIESHVRLLDNHVAQLASKPSRTQDTFYQPEPNPREQCNVDYVDESETYGTRRIITEQRRAYLERQRNPIVEEPEDVYLPPPPRPPPIPFSQRLQRTPQVDGELTKFADMWEKMEIAQPLQEAIAQTPSYEKFLKDTLVKKEKLEEEPIIVIAECNDVLQQNLPAKMANPGSFSIPCQLGNVSIPSALCDTGASVRLLPKTTYDKLNVDELKPTKMIFQLADKSVKAPLGTLEDVPLKAGNVYVLIDFVVIDMNNRNDESVILGRPFLNTVDAVIHSRKDP
ncbi:PREDICTED: uncharacterized protein LOC104801960 [Tarenaya hassleriana]|uniref:uncharacterized protein LOC104801960 n=1 Tax=Tarenaya hassleriana TaxID=28532 RepID=UPI00053C9B8D|nr:PREDICTED: uncharacterized protein LOC104801960 [Tarenaya hassleriana]